MDDQSPMSRRVRGDLTGRRFGRLVALEEALARPGGARWRCRCNCGAETVVYATNLRSGHTTSCGCWQREVVGEGAYPGHPHPKTHGRSKTPEYGAWRRLRHRVRASQDDAHPIRLDPRWDTFECFLADMGPQPAPGAGVVRHDPGRPYGPGNGAWVSRADRPSRRHDAVWLTHDGEARPLMEWASARGITVNTLRARVARGWSDAEALGRSVRPRRPQGDERAS